MGREKIRERGERRGRTLGQEGWAGVKCRELDAIPSSAELGAKIYGAELGASHSGAEPLTAHLPVPMILAPLTMAPVTLAPSQWSISGIVSTNGLFLRNFRKKNAK